MTGMVVREEDKAQDAYADGAIDENHFVEDRSCGAGHAIEKQLRLRLPHPPRAAAGEHVAVHATERIASAKRSSDLAACAQDVKRLARLP